VLSDLMSKLLEEKGRFREISRKQISAKNLLCIYQVIVEEYLEDPDRLLYQSFVVAVGGKILDEV
jgi:hypothetical protein